MSRLGGALKALRRRSARRPRLSVVVVAHDIPRELSRTLRSLSANHQEGIAAADYEVVVVDNGSDPAIGPEVFAGLPGRFRIVRVDPAPPSPARAVNRGLAAARGEVVGVMIDGARLVTPGLLRRALEGSRLFDCAVVASLGRYLGADFQSLAIASGHGPDHEDRLLASIGWPADGYRLFEISTPDESSLGAGFAVVSESNALFLRREHWQRLGGADERFSSPGGGFLNLDLFQRALELPGARLVLLLGEGTFHQAHGGVATNAPATDFPERYAAWLEEYRAVRGEPYRFPRPAHPPTLLGALPPAALTAFVQDLLHAHGTPLSAPFDRSLWTRHPPRRPGDPVAAALVDLAHVELRAQRFEGAAAAARMAREVAPEEPEPQRLLTFLAPAFDPRRGHPETYPPSRRARLHFVLGEGHRLRGRPEAATEQYLKALACDPDLVEAHLAWARLKLPGPDYCAWLERLHETLRPRRVVEIGVGDGRSLALVRPPSLAFGIDPACTVAHPLRAETRIFLETSDAFFARDDAAGRLGGPVDLGFIDGLHLFEQALRDFMSLERLCGPGAVLLLHDTLPLDEPTQRRERTTRFHSGDVWKTVLCLREYRPDLEIFTIAAAPTGLTVVTGLDPSSDVLSRRYEEALRRFTEVPYGELAGCEEDLLALVPNDPDAVAGRLDGRGRRRGPADP